MNQASNQIDQWKSMLDEYLQVINITIEKSFSKFETQLMQKKFGLVNLKEEVKQHNETIKELLDNYTKQIEISPNYIAYELLDKDPLNEKSVEYLCGQAEIIKEQAEIAVNQLDFSLEADYKLIKVKPNPKFEFDINTCISVMEFPNFNKD